jgi:hypothetical protein
MCLGSVWSKAIHMDFWSSFSGETNPFSDLLVIGDVIVYDIPLKLRTQLTQRRHLAEGCGYWRIPTEYAALDMIGKHIPRESDSYRIAFEGAIPQNKLFGEGSELKDRQAENEGGNNQGMTI